LQFIELYPFADPYLNTDFLGKFYKSLLDNYGPGKLINPIITFETDLLEDLASRGEEHDDDDDEEEVSPKLELLNVDFNYKKQIMKISFAMAVKLEIEGVTAVEILVQTQSRMQLKDKGEEQEVILKDVQIKALKIFEGNTEKSLEGGVLMSLANSMLKKHTDKVIFNHKKDQPKNLGAGFVLTEGGIHFEEDSIVLEGNLDVDGYKEFKDSRKVRDIVYARKDDENYISAEFIKFWLHHEMDKIGFPVSWSKVSRPKKGLEEKAWTPRHAEEL